MTRTIKPKLGIGDLLILKIINKTKKIDKIIVSTGLINEYRLEPKKYLNFLNIFIEKLFDNPEITYEEDMNNLLELSTYDFNGAYLFDHYNFGNFFENIYGEYIVIHTKARFDYLSNKFNNEIINLLVPFFNNFKSKYKILLLGEKNVEQNAEAKIHNIISLYDDLLLLKNNNDLIDLTYDMLYSSNDYNDFEKDIHIINNAIYNIGFGYGGPLNISMAFSLNNIFYVDKLEHKCLDTYQKINKNIFRNIDEFINCITINC
jgi:hypothetical protein